jgi:hypothetical protein
MDKISKDNAFNEDSISGRNTDLANKVMALIGAIRQRKSYQYSPLYVVKCGEGSGM